MRSGRWAITLGGALLAACSGGKASRVGIGGPPPGEATLRFVAGPTRTRARVPFPEIQVMARDPMGAPAADGTEVHLELVPPDNGGTLLGTLRATTAAGVARFIDVAVDRGGTYRLVATATGHVAARTEPADVLHAPLHLVLMIADGWGYKQVEAARLYTAQEPVYTTFASHAMATYDVTTLTRHNGVGYDPVRAWSEFSYPLLAATDSAAAATAMYAGEKTTNGRIGAGASGNRLAAFVERADTQGLAIGAVSTVPVSHATPAAWLAHNTARSNYYALADEMLWGDPSTTGNPGIDLRYGGSLGPSTVDAAVILGGGHPSWAGEEYLRRAMRDKLAAESGTLGAWHLVERIRGQEDGGARLLAAATMPSVQRLCGLFGGAGGNLEFRRADGSGASLENPTLAQMTAAALEVLQRREPGFALMVEAGAVDYAGHGNNLDECLGEMIDFERAVRAVVEWVDRPGDPADWSNTLLVVTGDHETGYLTRGPNLFPDRPLGEVSPRTLGLERPVGTSGRRASWEDLDRDGAIDPGETVYWMWHAAAHSNTLVPLYVRGTGAELFAASVVGTDPVRGGYVENTSIHGVFQAVLMAPR